MKAKKCAKKREACKIIVLVIKPIAFVTSSLLSPSSDLKVSIYSSEVTSTP